MNASSSPSALDVPVDTRFGLARHGAGRHRGFLAFDRRVLAAPDAERDGVAVVEGNHSRYWRRRQADRRQNLIPIVRVVHARRVLVPDVVHTRGTEVGSARPS